MSIREYRDETDRAGLRHCVESLQNFERELVPSMPPGSEIADAYIVDMLNKCTRYRGKLLVLEIDADIAGFVSVYASMISEELEDGPEEFAYIGDLVVLEKYRAHGYGRALLNEAEAIAVKAGAVKMRIGVLAENKNAFDLYQSLDYKPFVVQLEKNL